MKKLQLNKKGVLEGVPAIVTAFVMVAVMGGIALLITQGVISAANSTGYFDDVAPTTARFFNQSAVYIGLGYGSNAVTTLLQWLPLIALVIASVIIISLIRSNQ